jgi:hypothetical protein
VEAEGVWEGGEDDDEKNELTRSEDAKSRSSRNYEKRQGHRLDVNLCGALKRRRESRSGLCCSSSNNRWGKQIYDGVWMEEHKLLPPVC